MVVDSCQTEILLAGRRSMNSLASVEIHVSIGREVVRRREAELFVMS